jgi:RNA polymerase sigma-70 factor (ECF subfamily)
LSVPPAPQKRWGNTLPDELAQAPDLELARRAQAGDEDAFAEIVRRYSRRVFSVASRFFRTREQVEEAAQEVFLKAFTELGSFEGRGSLEGWLTRIATNSCLNMIRGAKRRPEFTASNLTEDETRWLEAKMSAAASERHAATERQLVAADLADRVLETLSSDDRLVLLLVDGEETPVKEVAEMTGWSESKVKVQAFRARRRMRQALEKLLGTREEARSD